MDDVQFTASLDRLLDSELSQFGIQSQQQQQQYRTSTSSVDRSIRGIHYILEFSESTVSSANNNNNNKQLKCPLPSLLEGHHRNLSSIPVFLLPLYLHVLCYHPSNHVAMNPSTITQRLAFAMPPMAAPSNMVMPMHTSHTHHQQQHAILDKREHETLLPLPFPKMNRNENVEDRIAINENSNDPDALPNKLRIFETS